MIDRWIDTVCSHAGWPRPGKIGQDKFRFRLEPDMVVDAWSPEERIMILEAQVVKLESHDRVRVIKKAATAVLPRVFKDSATLSLDPATRHLCLHRTVTLGALRATDFPGVMENFLNELAFYRSL